MREKSVLQTNWIKLILLVLFLAGETSAKQLPLAEFDQKVNEILRRKKVSASAVSVVRRGEILLTKGFGEIASGLPTTDKSFFRIASVSKVFTTLGILKLVDRGIIGLDQPIVRYLPWFKLSGGGERWREITVRHLLTHSSGISRELACPFTTDLGEWIPLQNLAECVLPRETFFKPGSRLKYSNLGMILLGRIIAETSGSPGKDMEEKFQSFMIGEIFSPMGMKDSHYTLNALQMQSLAQPLGHLENSGLNRELLPPAATTYISSPAWGVVTNARDLTKLLEFIFKVMDGQSNGLISRDLATRILKNPIQDTLGDLSSYQALGFSLKRTSDSVLVGHGGHFPGYTTQVYVDNLRQTGYVVLTNSIERSAASEILSAAQSVFGASGEVSYDLLSNSVTLPSDGSEVIPDFDEAYRRATCLDDLNQYRGSYKGWPLVMHVSTERQRLVLNYAGKNWILIPECQNGLRFRLDQSGSPNYVIAFGERLVFGRNQRGEVDRLMHGEVYTYRRQ